MSRYFGPLPPSRRVPLSAPTRTALSFLARSAIAPGNSSTPTAAQRTARYRENSKERLDGSHQLVDFPPGTIVM
ncbi:MAG: hypothetical protein BJ554DRAFT_1253, partial [Olpidium bornovanus]